MDFISNQPPQIEEMLEAIGVPSVDALFESIPHQLRKHVRLDRDDGISELEGMRLMESLANKNTFSTFENYLGAGAYEHHIPALVGAICSKSEFLTSYTPYQAEASQGMLQAIFEFQSTICALTGLDVANASLYDGASACAEATLMALRCNPERNKVLIAGNLHPHYRYVVDQYLNQHHEVTTIPFLSNGQLDHDHLRYIIDEGAAAVLVQYPNFFGGIDDIAAVSALAKEKGALTLVCANPLVYGLFASANHIGADIAIGDCQPFGIPLQFGGPYAGYIACKQVLARQMPGRIVGETRDTQGRRGFVLTMQAREQHIRREKATSNICTNQALAALASLITFLWYGKKGIHALALTNYQRTAYLRHSLEKLPFVKSMGEVTTFNEFFVRFTIPLERVFKHFRSRGIEPGISLGMFFPEFADSILIAVTEMKSREQLDRYISVAKELS